MNNEIYMGRFTLDQHLFQGAQGYAFDTLYYSRVCMLVCLSLMLGLVITVLTQFAGLVWDCGTF